MLSLLHRISPFGDSQRGLTAGYVYSEGSQLSMCAARAHSWVCVKGGGFKSTS